LNPKSSDKDPFAEFLEKFPSPQFKTRVKESLSLPISDPEVYHDENFVTTKEKEPEEKVFTNVINLED
jgi:hypothetical protein